MLVSAVASAGPASFGFAASCALFAFKPAFFIIAAVLLIGALVAFERADL